MTAVDSLSSWPAEEVSAAAPSGVLTDPQKGQQFMHKTRAFAGRIPSSISNGAEVNRPLNRLLQVKSRRFAGDQQDRNWHCPPLNTKQQIQLPHATEKRTVNHPGMTPAQEASFQAAQTRAAMANRRLIGARLSENRPEWERHVNTRKFIATRLPGSYPVLERETLLGPTTRPSSSRSRPMSHQGGGPRSAGSVFPASKIEISDAAGPAEGKRITSPRRNSIGTPDQSDMWPSFGNKMADGLRMARTSNGAEKAELRVVEGAHEAHQVTRSLNLENPRQPWSGAKPLNHTQALVPLSAPCRWDSNDRQSIVPSLHPGPSEETHAVPTRTREHAAWLRRSACSPWPPAAPDSLTQLQRPTTDDSRAVGHEVAGHEILAAASELPPMDPRDGQLRTPRSTKCSPRTVSAAQDSTEMEMGDEEGYPVTKPKFAFLPGTASSMMSVVKPPRTPDRSTREYRRNEESTRDRCNEGQQGASSRLGTPGTSVPNAPVRPPEPTQSGAEKPRREPAKMKPFSNFGGWAFGVGASDRDIDGEKLGARNSRFIQSSGLFALANAKVVHVDKKAHREAMRKVDASPLCSWYEEPSFTKVPWEEPSGTVQPCGSDVELEWEPQHQLPSRRLYMYKDLIDVVPDPDEVRAMRAGPSQSPGGSDSDSSDDESSSDGDESSIYSGSDGEDSDSNNGLEDDAESDDEAGNSDDDEDEDEDEDDD